MSGFTPGPWVPRRAAKPDNTGGYDWAIIAPDKAIVAECFEVVDWAENGVDFDTRPVEANARLIAAAPDLLEALIAAREASELSDACQGLKVIPKHIMVKAAQLFDRARRLREAAILKATGVTS